MNTQEFLWVEKYRPTNVSDVILPAEMKATFEAFVKAKDFPNLLLAGPRGMGKTSVAKSLVREVGGESIVINGSLERNIDVIRERVLQFVSSVSMLNDGRKYVILDEADGLNALTQPALKAFIEEYSHNAGFILTANHISKVIPELQSRCSVIEFRIPSAEKPQLAMQFMKRLEEILKLEGVGYERKAIAALIQKWFPDWRRVLNEVQRYSSKGAIDSGVLATVSDESIKDLILHMKKKDFTAVRKWVAENTESSSQALFKAFYDQASQLFTPASVPEVAVTLAKYGFQSVFAVDQEVNVSAAMAEIMLVASWRE